MKRLMLTTFLVGLFFFAQGIVVASEVSDFKYQAPVKGEEKQTVSVRLKLPHEIIKNTSAGFKDLRLFDDTGVEIPYVIYAQSRPKETPKYFTWEIVNYHYTDSTQTIVLKKPRIISMA
ncbi:MAG: hypothetical protein JRI53_11870 [Deltaproteobacteria bacterium]|nr:hypothetical protein [Deltaproteobacteria bacterium]